MAKTLNVPMDIISLKPVDVLTSPQNSPSWGSWTTDAMCSSAQGSIEAPSVVKRMQLEYLCGFAQHTRK